LPGPPAKRCVPTGIGIMPRAVRQLSSFR